MPGGQWNDSPSGEFGSFGSPEFSYFEFLQRGLAGSCEDFSTFDPGSVRF